MEDFAIGSNVVVRTREDGIEVETHRVFMQSGRVICQDRWIERDGNNAPRSMVSAFYEEGEGAE